MDAWTVKLTAGLILTLSGAAAGYAMGRASWLRVRQLEDMRGAFEELAVNMLEKLMPLQEALSSCRSEVLEEVAVGMNGAAPGEAFLHAKDRFIRRGGLLSCFVQDDLDALMKCFDRLGGSGLTGQKQILEETKAYLARAEKLAEEKARQQAGLYGRLGLLAGMAAAICLM